MAETMVSPGAHRSRTTVVVPADEVVDLRPAKR
jgi:hypothetical protein